MSATVCTRCGKPHVNKRGKPSCSKHRAKARDEEGKMVPCRRTCEPGRDCCRFHGGTQPVGPASPNWKSGKYSRYLPARYQERFEESIADPELISLRRQIALCDAREDELLRRLSSGESGSLWGQLSASVVSLRAAITAKDVDAQRDAILAITDGIERGRGDEVQWADLHRTFEQRRRLSETERKRVESMQAYVTREQGMALVGRLLAIIADNVKDRDVIARIALEVNALVNIDQDGERAKFWRGADASVNN